MALCKNEIEAKTGGVATKIVSFVGERVDGTTANDQPFENNKRLARVMFLCDADPYTLNILQWLVTLNFCQVTAVVIPSSKASIGNRIRAITDLSEEQILRGDDLSQLEVQEKIRSWQPDIILSVYFPHILRREILEIPRLGAINLHPSLLPYNRGYWPEVWALIEQTPAGVTLHYMDDKVDTGDIIAQREVPRLWSDTGETLLRRIEETGFSLLKEELSNVLSGKATRTSQKNEGGTVHKHKEIEKISKISLDKTYTGIELINILRAVTIPAELPGAYFEIPGTGEKVFMELRLRSESEVLAQRENSLSEIGEAAAQKKLRLAAKGEAPVPEFNLKSLISVQV